MAAGIGQCAQILRAQERWAEADARFEEGLILARRIDDLGLQGLSLQHQGGLHLERGKPTRSAELYEEAMKLFQQVGDTGNEMRTCTSLASAERERGQLDAAEAWYGRARELALELDDRHQLGVNAQNLGILYQTRAEQAPNAQSQAAWLRRALASIEESLAIWPERNDQVHAAMSYSQLGVLHQMLGDLDVAERKFREAREIWEPLDHPNLWKIYGQLAEIAEARGDAAAAAEWAAKRDAKLAELERPRGGGGDGIQLAQLAEPLLALARAVYTARAARAELEPEAAEAVATLCGLPSPLGEVGAFLRAVAAGDAPPPLPVGLPAELARTFEGLMQAVAELPE